MSVRLGTALKVAVYMEGCYAVGIGTVFIIEDHGDTGFFRDRWKGAVGKERLK